MGSRRRGLTKRRFAGTPNHHSNQLREAARKAVIFASRIEPGCGAKNLEDNLGMALNMGRQMGIVDAMQGQTNDPKDLEIAEKAFHSTHKAFARISACKIVKAEKV